MKEQLSIRSKLIYTTVMLSFILGWVITFLGFYAPPHGEVNNTVIVIFGQALTYCAYGLGLKEYGDYMLKRFEDKHKNKTNDDEKQSLE